MKENKQVDWKDYDNFISEVLDRLMIKKLVALFDDYDTAEGDLFLELFPCVSDDADLADEIWLSYKSENDIRKWFNSL